MFMKRRDFLKVVAVSVGALVVGCGPKDDSNDTIEPNNTTGTNNGLACDDTLEAGTQFFPQSVASGDPASSTVILWTRVSDGDADLELELQVALDEEFEQRLELGDDGCALVVAAVAAYDHCVKVRLTDLDAATTYYYRFVYEKDGTRYTSNIGRTKTAPAADADVAAKFAFVSCQDFNGKYFNSYKQLLKTDDLDFVVHLGDYVYETTGDPQFQQTTPDRVTTFRNPDEAIAFNAGTDDEFFAAKSLGNYRDLYRLYRSDAELQRAHERYPWVIIWDDHEFSDDCFGATATYFDGAQDELDETRRKNANQAWFEYMPVDYLDAPDFQYDASVAYGDDIRIYRDIRWGQHAHLVMTDLRSYRSDHVIPEDMFPGLLLLTQAELETAVGSLPSWADPYIDIAAHDGGSYATVMTEAAPIAGYPASAITGNISATYVNAIVRRVNTTRPMDMQIPQIDLTAITDRGLTALSLGKTSPTSSLGSRYFVVDEPFSVWSKFRYAETNGQSENALGDDQEAWFLETMRGSDATWKIWGNEFPLVQRSIDLTTFEAVVGAAFAKVFSLSAEDWEGQRNKRDELIGKLSEIDNVVAITGDIHAFFAGTPFVKGDTSKRIIEFVTGAISSASMKTLLINTAESDPTLAAAGAGTLARAISSFLFAATKPNPPLAYGSVDEAGFAILTCDGTSLDCTFHQLPEAIVPTDVPAAELDESFTTKSFRVAAGTPDLLTTIGGSEKRWDPDVADWV